MEGTIDSANLHKDTRTTYDTVAEEETTREDEFSNYFLPPFKNFEKSVSSSVCHGKGEEEGESESVAFFFFFPSILIERFFLLPLLNTYVRVYLGDTRVWPLLSFFFPRRRSVLFFLLLLSSRTAISRTVAPDKMKVVKDMLIE